MTTMELRADIFENLNFLLDNEEAMTQLKKYLCQLRNKVERDSPCKYDVGELTQRVRQGTRCPPRPRTKSRRPSKRSRNMVKIKLIYFHEKDTCHIVAVWDCRNNPKLLQDKLGEE